jgi:hypothetical protein
MDINININDVYSFGIILLFLYTPLRHSASTVPAKGGSGAGVNYNKVKDEDMVNISFLLSTCLSDVQCFCSVLNYNFRFIIMRRNCSKAVISSEHKAGSI